MQLRSDPAFCFYRKRAIDFTCTSGNIPPPGWPCSLQSVCTGIKLEDNFLVCVFKKWQRSRDLGREFPATSTVVFLYMRFVLGLDILYLYILVYADISTKDNCTPF